MAEHGSSDTGVAETQQSRSVNQGQGNNTTGDPSHQENRTPSQSGLEVVETQQSRSANQGQGNNTTGDLSHQENRTPSQSVWVKADKIRKMEMHSTTITTNVYHHHEYIYNATPVRQDADSIRENPAAPASNSAEITGPNGERILKISDSVYMYVNVQLAKGYEVYKGYQKYVSEGEEENNQPVAIKKLVPGSKEQIQEVKHLVALTYHPNIVQILSSAKHTSAHTSVLYIVMELCSRNLQDYWDQNHEVGAAFDFDTPMSFTKQLIRGMRHIHKNEIIHRDVKPQNVLISENENVLKYTDFGIGKRVTRDRAMTTLTNRNRGTADYSAPEVQQSMDEITEKADIFSLGIVLFGVWSNGKHPYGNDSADRGYNIKNDRPDFLALQSLVPEHELFLDLVRGMLRHDPNDRPTIEEVTKHELFVLEGDL